MATKKKKKLKAWHFLPRGMKLMYGDGRRVRDGETLTHKGDLELCCSGLHASLKVMDAFTYSHDRPILCRVEVSGEISYGADFGFSSVGRPKTWRQSDKLVATERKCIWHVDAAPVMKLLPAALGLLSLEEHIARRAGGLPLIRRQARSLRVSMVKRALVTGESVSPRAVKNAATNSWWASRALFNNARDARAGAGEAVLFCDDDVVSKEFRRLIGLQRRNELKFEALRIARRLNSISKMSNDR